MISEGCAKRVGSKEADRTVPSGEVPWTSDVPAENRDGGGAPDEEQHAQRHQVGESLGIGEPGSAGLSGWREACQHQVMKGLECHAWKFRLCMGHSCKGNGQRRPEGEARLSLEGSGSPSQPICSPFLTQQHTR